MDKLHFDDFEEFVVEMNNTICDANDKDDDYFSISIIGKYENIKKLIHELVYIGYEMESIEISPYDVDNYDDEYIVDLGLENDIWCQKMKNGDSYLNTEANIVYVFDDCSSKIIKHCKSDCVYEVSIGEDDEENNDDADAHGFSLSHSNDSGYYSFSYYTTNSLSEKDIQEMVDKLGFSFCK